MKEGIVGYITGIINSHQRKIEVMTGKATEYSIHQQKCFKSELSDLLDYVIDIPEETVTDTYIEINRLRDILEEKQVRSEDLAFEIIILRQRVAELEESCENMCEVERNLQQKIKHFEIDNAAWQKLCKELRETNKKHVRRIRDLSSQLRRVNK